MDTDGDRLWLLCGLLALFCLLRAWYAVCEAALTEANDAVIHTRAETDARFRRADRLISQPARLRRGFTMHRILSAVWLGVLTFGLFGGRLASLFPFRDAALLSGVLLSLCVTLLLAVLTDLFPRRLARRTGERFVRLCAGSVQLLFCLLLPLWGLASFLTGLLCRLTGTPAAETADVVTEEEIRLLVDAGNETGGIEESQREMINNIFTFDDVPVSDVMTHRKDMAAVPKDATASETAALATAEGFSRIPVYEGQVDNIVGVVLVKDLLPLVGRAEDCTVTEIMRRAIFVPDTAKCRDVFQRMRREKMQLAIVSDEYGGTAGMVTMEDLLEEIVGSIQDEYDDEEAEITELSAGVYSIDGAADPEDILPRLGLRPELAAEFDTMSAYVVHLIGRIPEEGERPAVEDGGVRYTLLSCEDNWISRIRAEVQTKAEGA
ncbi:MAG: hemolysin family protein [Oscillospiraceae bacterium]|nr:hemolysin family protein [Oscillospiraceae bacterium]